MSNWNGTVCGSNTVVRNRLDLVSHGAMLEALEPRLLLSASSPQPNLELFNTSTALFVENQGQQNHSDIVIPSGDALLSSSDAATESWTTGVKNFLYIRVDFPDITGDPVAESAVQSTFLDVDAYLQRNSYGTLSINQVDVTPTLRLPHTSDWYVANGAGTLLIDAKALASTLGFNAADYWNYAAAFPAVSGWASWVGKGWLGSPGIWLNGSFGEDVTIHEIGHNLGAWHSGFWEPTDPADPIGAGTQIEYGSPFDEMGHGKDPDSEFSAYWRQEFNWFDASQVTDVIQSGLHRIHALDQGQTSPTNTYAVTVDKDGDRVYWLEYRDTGLASGQLFVNWDPWSGTDQQDISLIDMNPQTSTADDAPLAVGRVFHDPVANIWITPIDTGQDSEPWIDVYVSFEAPWSVSGEVFHDQNGDGNQDPLDPSLSDVVIFADSNGDGLLNPDEFRTMSIGTSDNPIDQVQDETFDIQFLWSSASEPNWQEFVPTLPWLTEVELYVGQTSTPPNQLEVSVEDPATGEVLWSTVLENTEVPIDDGWLSVTLSEPLAVEVGKTYRLQAQHLSGSNNGFYVWWGKPNPNNYPQGRSNVSATHDYAFRTHGVASAGGAGQFDLIGFGAGPLTVRQVRPAGWIQTTPSANDGYDVVLSTGVQIANTDFGLMPFVLEGDLNGDGFVGVDDLNLVLVNWNQNVPTGDSRADPSGDGFVGVDDLNLVLINWNASVSPPLIAGDLNADGFVGVDDLNIVLINWNQNVTPGDLLSGDATGEGFVGVDDLNIVLVNWNNGTPPVVTAQATSASETVETSGVLVATETTTTETTRRSRRERSGDTHLNDTHNNRPAGNTLNQNNRAAVAAWSVQNRRGIQNVDTDYVPWSLLHEDASEGLGLWEQGNA